MYNYWHTVVSRCWIDSTSKTKNPTFSADFIGLLLQIHSDSTRLYIINPIMVFYFVFSF